ncbi:MAG: Gfo/Idh/MocA family oxidoreductase [Candidatus Sphingomonas phytovorans]|nr:Gfo/Idh/MocA family oxidoreductase [Sphingomonas sp.]WEK00137.1 MAG: Gfo/Idh/MocA family oxidoreductase [Sphingomonas sp.]
MTGAGGSPPAVGVIGCGMVSHAYLGTILRSDAVRLKAVSSRTMASAAAQASRYGCAAMTTADLLDDPEIEFVVNLAPPSVHHAIGRAVLEAGKHLYSEKPFATRLEDARDLLDLAERRGLSIACAPDTFLGEGSQRARRLVDRGAIGSVMGGSVAMLSRGMESWHPNPAFFYRRGGGPLLDVGPYYVTQLVNLLGPVVEVVAIGTRPRDIRTGREGEPIPVEIATSVNAALLFESGANVALSLSWDVTRHRRAPIELYGDEGSLQAPDPNVFGGVTRISKGGDWAAHGVESAGPKIDPAGLAQAVRLIGQGVDPISGRPLGADCLLAVGDKRGIGLLDQVESVRRDRPARANGQLAYHVLEALLGLEASAEGMGRVAIRSRVARPAPLPEVGD